MAVVLPVLRLVVIVSNVWLSFKTLKPLPISRSRRNDGPNLRASAARKREMKACLSVWIVWAFWSASEKVVDRTVGLFIPFYSNVKILFILVLLISRAVIAEPLLLHLLRPLLKPYTSSLDSAVDLFTFFGDLSVYLISLPWAYLRSLMTRPSRVEVLAPASTIQQSEEPHVTPEAVRDDQNKGAHPLTIVDQSLVKQSLPGGARKVFEQTYVLDQTVYSTRSQTQQVHSISGAHAADSGRPSGSRIVLDTAVGTRKRKGRLETDDDKDPALLTFHRSNSTRPPSRAEDAQLYDWAGPITANNNAPRATNPSRHSKQSIDVSYYAIRNLNPSITPAAVTSANALVAAQLPVTAAPLSRRPSSIRTSSREPPPMSSEPQSSSQNVYPRAPPSPSFPGSFFYTPPPTRPPSLRGDAPGTSAEANHVEYTSLSVSSVQGVASISSASSASSSPDAPAERTRPLSVAERRTQLLEAATTSSSSNSNTTAREKNRAAATVPTKRPNKQTLGPQRAPVGTTSRRGENSRPPERPNINPTAAALGGSHDGVDNVKRRPVSAATLARRNRITSASGVPKVPAASTTVSSTAALAAQAAPEVVSLPTPLAAVPMGRKRSVSGHTKAPLTGTLIAPSPEVQSIPETHSSGDSDTGTTVSAKKKRRVEALRRLSDNNERERLAVEKALGAEASSTERSDSDSGGGGWSELDELKTPLHVARRKLRPFVLRRTPIPISSSQPLAAPMPLVTSVVEANASDDQSNPLRVQAPEVLDEDEELLPKEPRRRGLRSEDKVPPITSTRVSTRNVAAAAAAARRRAAGLGVGVAVGGVVVSGTAAGRGRDRGKG